MGTHPGANMRRLTAVRGKYGTWANVFAGFVVKLIYPAIPPQPQGSYRFNQTRHGNFIIVIQTVDTPKHCEIRNQESGSHNNILGELEITLYILQPSDIKPKCNDFVNFNKALKTRISDL